MFWILNKVVFRRKWVLLVLIKSIILWRNVDKTVSASALKAVHRHLWYLPEKLVPTPSVTTIPLAARYRKVTALLATCVEKKEHALYEKLVSFSEVGELIYVRLSCRKKLTDKGTKRNFGTKPETPKKLRSCSNEISFSWKNCCFVCAKQVRRTKNKRLRT